MFAFQGGVFGVPAVTGNVFIVIDDLATPRVVILQNMSSGALTCQFQYSTDGGVVWSNLGASFVLDAAGAGGSDLRVEKVTQSGRIRLRGSGGTNTRELLAAVLRASISGLTTLPLIQI